MNVTATDDMEAAVESLVRRHRRVIVLLDYKSVRPIRLNSKQLQHVPGELTWAWSQAKGPIIERFQRDGGLLYFRSEPRHAKPVMPECDAVLFCEAPFNWRAFDSLAQFARQEVVIYRPPTWDLHQRTVEVLFPRRENYETLELFMRSLRGIPMSEGYKRLIAASGFERGVAFTVQDVANLTCWDEKTLRYLLRPFSRKVTRWHPYLLRMAPDDPDLLWGYAMLQSQTYVSKRVRALRVNLAIGRPHGFPAMLRLLLKYKYVSADDCVYTYDFDASDIDPERIEAANNVGRSRWFKMREYVDNLPEYQG